jgi:hypothetical protein
LQSVDRACVGRRSLLEAFGLAAGFGSLRLRISRLLARLLQLFLHLIHLGLDLLHVVEQLLIRLLKVNLLSSLLLRLGLRLRVF